MREFRLLFKVSENRLDVLNPNEIRATEKVNAEGIVSAIRMGKNLAVERTAKVSGKGDIWTFLKADEV
jgi:hypothetical protein